MGTNETPEAKAAKEAAEVAAKAEAKAAKAKKVEKNPDFVDMINPRGFEVEVHKDRVEELSKVGYKMA